MRPSAGFAGVFAGRQVWACRSDRAVERRHSGGTDYRGHGPGAGAGGSCAGDTDGLHCRPRRVVDRPAAVPCTWPSNTDVPRRHVLSACSCASSISNQPSRRVSSTPRPVISSVGRRNTRRRALLARRRRASAALPLDFGVDGGHMMRWAVPPQVPRSGHVVACRWSRPDVRPSNAGQNASFGHRRSLQHQRTGKRRQLPRHPTLTAFGQASPRAPREIVGATSH